MLSRVADSLYCDPSLWSNTAAFAASVFHYGNTPRNPLTHVTSFVRSEMFNACNAPQFSNPRASLGTEYFGRVTGTSAANRQIQSPRYATPSKRVKWRNYV